MEERVGERRPPCRKATAAQVCKPVDAPLPNPLPALGWRGEGEISGGSVKMRPELVTGGGEPGWEGSRWRERPSEQETFMPFEHGADLQEKIRLEEGIVSTAAGPGAE